MHKKKGLFNLGRKGLFVEIASFRRFLPSRQRPRPRHPLPLSCRHGRSRTDALGKQHECGFQVYLILGKVLDFKTGINEHFGKRGVVLDAML